jgi:hypothetical protein
MNDRQNLTLDRPTDVLIAGHVRRGLVWLRPGRVEIYEHADRTSPKGFGT